MSQTEELVLVSCPSRGTKARASSTLDKNTNLYGAHNVLDLDNDCTCWNSDGDTGMANKKKTKALLINFNRLVDLSCKGAYISVMFQGGFVGLNCSTFVSSDGKEYKCMDVDDDDPLIDAEDTNIAQKFDFSSSSLSLNEMKAVKYIKLTFEGSTDFYGRITIYKLEIWGKEND